MSHHQSRVDRSDGQLRKSGGRSGHGRGFSGGGSGGRGGGGGGGAAYPHQLSSSSSSSQPSLSINRSFKKSGNSGQGGQSSINPASLVSETSTATATPRAVQNGGHGQPPPQGSSTIPMPSGPKPGDTSVPRISRAPPKAPPLQSAVGSSDSAAPSTPVKGDGTKPFALQFGTISPGIVNGLQIPARTSSAPPNLDEQKRDQACHDSFRAVPTQPIPPGPKQQTQPARKDVSGINQSTGRESHPPIQIKREVAQQISSVPIASQPKSAALPIPGISMPMQFPQASIPMQFGGPGPQQMPMTMPIGNVPQVPQQVYVHNIQSHRPRQAVVHQGQGLGFGPPISHQLGPQSGNLGIGIAAPKFAQQQQSGNLGGPRKTTVKITHPETHEELRLDKRTDSYTNGGSSGQRPPDNATQPSQPIPFAPHYFPHLPPNSYNPSPIFFPTSTSVTTGSQPPRFSYPAGQSRQAISFMNPSVLNPMPGSKPLPPSCGPSEPVKLGPSLVTVPMAPNQGSAKPTAVPIGPKGWGPSVTISMPVSKTEEPKLLKSPREATVIHHQRDSEVSTDGSHQPETSTQTPGTTQGSCAVAVTSVVSTQRTLPGTSRAPSIPSGDSGSVVKAFDGKPSRWSDSLKDQPKKPSKKDLWLSQQHQLTDESASVTTSKLSSVRISKDGSFEDVNSSSEDVLTTSSNLLSCAPEHNVSTESRTVEAVKSKAIPTGSVSSGVISKGGAPQDVPMRSYDSLAVVSSDRIPVKDIGLAKESSCSGPDMDEKISKDLYSTVCQTDNAYLEVECRKKMSEEFKHEKAEVSEVPVRDNGNAKVFPVPSIVEPSKDVKPVTVVKQEDSGMKSSETLIDSTGVKKKSDLRDREAPTSLEPKSAAGSDKDIPCSPNTIKSELETTCSHGNISTFSRVECRKKMSEEFKREKAEVSEVPIRDNGNAKVFPVPSIIEPSKDVKPVAVVKQEDSGMKNSETLIDSTGVKKKSDLIDREAPTSLEPKTAAGSDKDIPCSPNIIKSELETTCSHDNISSFSRGSHPEAVASEAPASERTNRLGSSVMETPTNGPTSSVTSGPMDKLPLESTKAKPITGKKKRRKEILSKADAAGTSDLYNAYKGPEEKHQLANTSESVGSSLPVNGKNVNADKVDKDITIDGHGQSKAEVDDWEDAADRSTPKLENGKQVNDANKHPDESETTGMKKYTRDFLLTLSEQCTDLPVGCEIGSDIADALMNVSLGSVHGVDRDPYPSPVRVTDRSPGGVSRNDRRGIGMMDDDRWSKVPVSLPLHDIRSGQGVNHGGLRNPRGQPSNQFPILPGPVQSLVLQGGSVRNNSDSDRWRNNSRGLMPPPQMPLQVMHKAERKYEVGRVSDHEQAKQRQLKAILNKLTPQNFEILFQQVKEVNIDNTVTLSGVIAQIFDKALMEPTFCEMYANFCFHLSGELPDFTENGKKITFRGLLLNKCQEEFERGEREQAEADRVEEEGEIKHSEEEREEKRIKARRRMLGNIRLIGELYKKKMLTERIMHECIQKFLGQYQNPDEEDLEALCKLMSTIGDRIDHPKAKEHIDTYFDRMLKLSTNHKLSSRVRFMLRDVIDLRKNRWQQRRKVEGPKKIDEVHRDAAQERQSQTSRLTRGPSMNSASKRGLPVDYGPRGSSVLPSPSSQIGGIRGVPTQVRGYGMQDVRSEDHHTLENRALSIPLTQRPSDVSITLGPQGGLARGMSIRGQPLISTIPLAETPLGIGDDRRMTSGPNVYNSTADRVPNSTREDPVLKYMPDRSSETSVDHASLHDRNAYIGNRESRVGDCSFDRFARTTIPTGQSQGSLGSSINVASDTKPLSEDALRDKSLSAIKEFYSAKDENEVVLCIKELNSPSFYPSMVSLWVTDAFERKDLERSLLATLLVNLCKSHDSLLSQVQLAQGFESVLSLLEDAMNDAPRAPEFLGHIFVKVILENVVPLRDLAKLIREGGEEPGCLLKSGLAAQVLGTILEMIKLEKGEPTLQEIIASSKLRLKDFRPPHSVPSKMLEAFL